MSVRTVSASPTTSNAGLNTKSLTSSTSTISSGSVTPWVRNSQWLTLPTVSDTEQKVVGLYAIQENANFIALTCSGAYTVNWGDGTIQNFASGVTAYYEYSYTNSAFDGTLTNEGYKQAIVTVMPQSGQNLTSFNIVVKHNQSGLQNGYSTGWLDLTLSLPNCTTLTIGNGSGTSTVIHGFLDQVTILNHAVTSMSNMFFGCTSLQSVPLFNTATVTDMSNMFNGCGSLQSVPLFNTVAVTNMNNMFNNCRRLLSVPLFNTVAVTNMSSMFIGCISLQSVPLLNTVAVTNMNNMFNACRQLETIPLFNTGATTSMSSMFNGCVSLKSVPLFNTAAVADMSGMFTNCTALQSVPLFNTGAVTNINSMFNTCRQLETIPLFNTGAVTNMNNMLANCNSLQSVPLFNTGAVTNISGLFANCSSLQSVPLFNTVAVTNMSTMFSGCVSLKSVPLFNTAAVTNMSNMFNGCSLLQSVPLFNTAAVTNMSDMFNGCSSLQSVPSFNTGAVTTSTQMFISCFGLSRIQVTGMRVSFSTANCKLSSTALNEIFTNLTPVTTTQTLTITSNYGVDSVVTKSVTTTAQSLTVPMAVTSDLVVGEFVTGVGTGITTGVSVASDVAANTFTLTNHGLTNGKSVSFSTLGTTTGISAWTIYFVVNATANTFQVSLTDGGAAIDLTGTNASLNARYPSIITAITPGVSITLDTPAATSASTTLSFRSLNSSTALLKNWTITF